MKNNIKGILVTIILIFSLLGCNLTPASENFYDEEIPQEELGSYSFGPLLDVESDELIQFRYNGEEIRIPYHVEGHGIGVTSEFAWFVMVDGLLQPTRLETIEGEIFRETSEMHNFTLEFRERLEFYVVFSPISGVIGERVSFISGTLLRPDFIPESLERPFFGIFHSLSATIPAEIYINSEISASFSSYFSNQLKEIPQEILEYDAYLRGIEIDDIHIYLDHAPRIGFFPYGEEIVLDYQRVISTDSATNANVHLFLYGGQEVTSRITLFVNHIPVRVNGADFIEIEMERGKMAVLNLELELTELEHFNSLYAIMMTTGEDYHFQDIFKTRTVLLVNE